MTLTLSRLLLNPLSREVRRDMASVVDLHRTVMKAFPEADQEPRRAHGVLYRLDVDERKGLVVLLVQSHTPPDWTHLPPRYLVETGEMNPAVKAVDVSSALVPERELSFRLRANPTKRVTIDGKSQRVELRGDSARLAWLRRKGIEAGFALCCDDDGSGLVITEESKNHGYRPQGTDKARITLQPVLFQGRLRITDAERFKRCLRDGIGPAKAYGFGLLSIAPP